MKNALALEILRDGPEEVIRVIVNLSFRLSSAIEAQSLDVLNIKHASL